MIKATFSDPRSVTIEDLKHIVVALNLPKELLVEISKHKNPLIGIKSLSGHVDIVFTDGSTFIEETD